MGALLFGEGGFALGMTIELLGDSAFLVSLGVRMDAGMVKEVRAVVRRIEGARLPWVVEVVPAYCTVGVVMEVGRLPGSLEEARRELERMVRGKGGGAKEEDRALRVVEVPVCYGGEFGPDLEEVAGRVGLSVEEVIRRHSAARYTVGCIGFTPGFAYLVGLPPKLAVARREVPRREVPAGSVAIGGGQTGIYPQVSPGGWHLIGRTAMELFSPGARPPARLQAGDEVRFVPVDATTFSGGER